MQNLTFSQRLRSAAAPVWEACIRHPFVQGIGNGTLSMEKFRYFMLQDYLYLFEYARVFALGVAKARQPEWMCIFARYVNEILHGEMNIHRAYMRRLKMDEETVQGAKPALANLSYTGYMLSVAHGGTLLEIVAAILACSWSYAEIGRTLALIPGAVEHPFYGEWIRGYASDEYLSSNQSLVDLMDALAEDATEAQCQYLEEIFVNCSRYELEFWNMVWEMCT